MPKEEAAVGCDEERGDLDHYRYHAHHGLQYRTLTGEEEEVNLNFDGSASRRSAAGPIKEGLRARIYSKQMLSEDDSSDSKVWHRRARIVASCSTACRIALLVSLFTAIVVACFTLPMDKMLNGFLIWIHGNLGPWGPVALALAYIPLTIFAVPASILTVGGGYLFGLPVGFLADSIGAAFGATAAFLVGRTIGRPLVLAKLKDYPQFQAISSAVQHSGFKIVLLLRLVPLLPFNVLNYLLSVTPVNLGAYMLASWIGMMIFTAMPISRDFGLWSNRTISCFYKLLLETFKYYIRRANLLFKMSFQATQGVSTLTQGRDLGGPLGGSVLTHLEEVCSTFRDNWRSSCQQHNPITGVLVYVGTTIKDFSDISHSWGHFTTFEWILLVIGFAASVLIIFLVSRVARRSLSKAILEIEAEKACLLPYQNKDATELCQPLVVRVDADESKEGKKVQHLSLN